MKGHQCDECGKFIPGTQDDCVQKYLLYKRGNKVTYKQVFVCDLCEDCANKDIAEGL